MDGTMVHRRHRFTIDNWTYISFSTPIVDFDKQSCQYMNTQYPPELDVDRGFCVEYSPLSRHSPQRNNRNPTLHPQSLAPLSHRNCTLQFPWTRQRRNSLGKLDSRHSVADVDTDQAALYILWPISLTPSAIVCLLRPPSSELELPIS
jgi:hypothetical protein